MGKKKKKKGNVIISSFFITWFQPFNNFLLCSGVTLLFNEPPDARKPDTRWRLYVFKAGEVLNGNSCKDFAYNLYQSNNMLLDACELIMSNYLPTHI